MRTKRRYFALLAVITLAILGTSIYNMITGGTCTVKMLNNGFGGNEINEDCFTVKLDDPSIAEVTRLRLVNNGNFGKTPEITFKALKSGTASAQVYYHGALGDGQEETETVVGEELRLYVSPMGMITETNTLSFSSWKLIEAEVLGFLLLTFVVMMISFFECMRKGRFSYSMVGFGGVAMYCGFMLLLSLYDIQWMNTFRNFLVNISDTGLAFVILTSPFMILLAAAIAFSNIRLLCCEGFRPQNMLGIGLAAVWMLGVIAIIIFDSRIITGNSSIDRDIAYSLAYVYSFFECMLLSVIVCAFLAVRFKAPFDKQYLLILGCCIRKDGTLTPILKGRADAAIDFERRQFAATGRHAKFVPSGGQGNDEVISESEAIKRYLMEQGYPEEQIVKEDKSVNTFQNIKFSRDRIAEDAGTYEGVKAAFATTNYHVFRGYILSRKNGLDAQGISAKTKWYFYPNAFLREFVGVTFEKKFSICVMVFLILLGYTLGLHLLDIKM